jgi:hypothetical protein
MTSALVLSVVLVHFNTNVEIKETVNLEYNTGPILEAPVEASTKNDTLVNADLEVALRLHSFRV